MAAPSITVSSLTAPSMVETSVTEDYGVSAISWAAIFAGGMAAAALSLILLAFGAGVGFSAVSPWSSGGTATAFSIAAGLYFIVTAMIASSVGGYLAGRLRSRWRVAHTHEIFFRDTAHGFLAWAFATLLSAAVLSSAAGLLVGGSTAAVSRIAGQAPAALSQYVGPMLRGDPGASSDPGSSMNARNEATAIFATALHHGGDFSASDRTYLAQLVAARAGIGQPEAQQRVSAAINEAKVAIDKARKAAAQFALWLTASLLVGAFSASLAAIEGGGLREGTWKYQV
ncbi:MAG TPA: hypothetical protein VIX87_01055 [Steroidobacteraceae bacterium]